VAFTLQVGRKDFSHRRMVVCTDLADAISVLETKDPRRVFTSVHVPADRPVVFMFTGQGAQYPDMARELYETESTFREQVDHCCEILKALLNLDLRGVLYPSEDKLDQAAKRLNQTQLTQPALFVIEHALARLWMSWGIQPAAMIGHSIGEYVAACLAGVLSLEDALGLVAARGLLMGQLPGGSMLAVPMAERDLKPLLGEHLSLAAINGPSFCVVSGPTEAVEALEVKLLDRELNSHRLNTSHAFHSTMMEPALKAFTEKVRNLRLNPPKLPYLSNLSGTWVTPEEATDPLYWARHMRETVKFSEGLEQLFTEPNRILLEVGPGHTLSSLAKVHPAKPEELTILSSLRRPDQLQSDMALLLESLGKLWLAGLEPDWTGFYTKEKRRRVVLPTYPFERERYWVEGVGDNALRTATAEGITRSRRPLLEEVRGQRGLQDEQPRLEASQSISMESLIAEIWQDALGVDRVNVDDNFFDLGGNSLLSIIVVARLEKKMGLRINPGELMVQTLGQLASACEERMHLRQHSEPMSIIKRSFHSIKQAFSLHAGNGK